MMYIDPLGLISCGEALSLATGFTPLGTLADVYTLVSGVDPFTGEKVSWFWRVAGIIPGLSEARKLKKLGKSVCCFVAGTQVCTRDGFKNIEDIKLDDEVWSKDMDTGQQDWKPVTHLFTKHDRGIYALNVMTDKGETIQIETTDDHPFWVPAKGWVFTLDLKPGDQIETDGYGLVKVNGVKDEQRTALTYNLEVADYHTYYVSKRKLLVHNSKCDLAKSAGNSLKGKPRIGSANKTDPTHRFNDIIDNYADGATKFDIPTKGPGGKIVRNSELRQIEGGLNGRGRCFEFIY